MDRANFGRDVYKRQDVMMPIMNGDKMCNILKSNIETSHIPIILLTALNDKESIIKGLQMCIRDRQTTK